MATPTAPSYLDDRVNLIGRDEIGRSAATPEDDDDKLSIAIARQLRARSSGIVEAIRPLMEFRDREISEHPEQTPEIIREYDRVLGNALTARYDAIDAAIRGTTMPFAEIGGTGHIIYANDAFLAFAPNSMGKPFADLFGARAQEVKTALGSGKGTSLLLEISRDGPPFSHVRLAMAPLQDEYGSRGAFAILLSAGAEDRLYESAPDGIIRLNSERIITFANTKASTIIGVGGLVGLSAASIFHNGQVGNEQLVDFEQWLERAEGRKEIAEFNSPDAKTIVPVRVSVLPSYHSVDQRAGTLLAFTSRANEIAREQIQRLAATITDPESLARGIMHAVGKIVPYDLASFGVYTADMTLFRVLVSDPDQNQNWRIRWFSVDASILPWLDSGRSWAGDIDSFVEENAPSADQQTLQTLRDQGLQSLLTLPVRAGGGRYRSALSLLAVGKDRYGQNEFEALQGLGIREALIAAETAFDRWRNDRTQRLSHDLMAAVDSQRLASILATGIAECFHWDYASVLEVDRLAGRFRLIAQHDASTSKCLTIPSDYEQPIDQGMSIRIQP